ncbi:hypothetical protein ACMGDH_10595 [Sphingomonas sp. DT-207]|uniref:hypothetical protein n=1 Tax=Sphingomonas sp. DT-207 TaxID=3396167 RepID=UPI003F1D4615
MAKPFTVRTWATPPTIGCFMLIAGTGLLIFFGVETDLTAGIHRWFSWLFLIGVAGHIVGNARPLRNHLKTEWGIASMAFFATVLAVSLSMAGSQGGSDLEESVKDALIDAPVASLAPLVRATPAVLVARLQAKGVPATGSETIRQLSATRGIDERELVASVFLDGKSK